MPCLHGAVIVSEGAPVTIGKETVVMENAVLKASGGSALQFPLSIGDRCIVGPHAYVVGATVGNGCFVASGTKVFNGAVLEDGSGVALGGIVHVNSHLGKGERCRCNTSRSAIPRRSFHRRKRRRSHAKMHFYEDVFNSQAGDDVRARAAQAYAKFLRKSHAQDKPLDEHRTWRRLLAARAKNRRRRRPRRSIRSST